MFPCVPGMKMGGHVEVFKTDEATGKQVLVHTTRPRDVCGRCGIDLASVGIVTATTTGTPMCPNCTRRD